MSNIGYEQGEICGRNGCDGVIEQHDTDTGCSCHISPPCSHCTTPREYCPACKWDAQEELEAEDHAALLAWQSRSEDEKQAERRYWELVRIKHLVKRFDPRDINYRILPHTHFTQICEGWFPKGMSRHDVRSRVNGTFGGRFERFCEESQTFRFVAYTD